MSRFILNAIDNHSHLRLNVTISRKLLKLMYVCICNAITESQIRDAADAGVDDLWGLQAELGVATNCGSCKDSASAILGEKRRARKLATPRLYVPSVVA